MTTRYKRNYSADQMKSYSGDMMPQGKLGERAFQELMQSYPGVVLVDDLRGDDQAHHDDIDFRCVFSDKRKPTFEVKTDRHFGKTDSLLFETDRHYHPVDGELPGHKEGWGYRSKADFLVEVSPYLNQIFLFRFADLRREVDRYIYDNRMNPANIRRIWITSDRTKSTESILLPKSYWEPAVFKVFDLPDSQRATWEELLNAQ